MVSGVAALDIFILIGFLTFVKENTSRLLQPVQFQTSLVVVVCCVIVAPQGQILILPLVKECQQAKQVAKN
jgi:hypothetical protein